MGKENTIISKANCILGIGLRIKNMAKVSIFTKMVTDTMAISKII
jgi:hypothetical protein